MSACYTNIISTQKKVESTRIRKGMNAQEGRLLNMFLVYTELSGIHMNEKRQTVTYLSVIHRLILQRHTFGLTLSETASFTIRLGSSRTSGEAGDATKAGLAVVSSTDRPDGAAVFELTGCGSRGGSGSWRAL
jgi:hypothetical protein